MKKIAVISAGALLLGLVGLALAHHAPEGPVEIKIEGAKKAPVSFDHTAHFKAKPALEKDCKSTCHHTIANNDDPDLAKYRCTGCHGLEPKGEAPDIKDAMHGKTGACYSCHYERGAENKFRCNDCHKE